MPAERGADAPFLAQREVVALSDVVQAEQLHHQMVGGVATGFYEGDRVVTGIGVKEISLERTQHIIGQPEPEHVAIERNSVVDVVHVQHRVAHAERPGAKAGNRAPGLERIACGLGAVKDFDPVAERIGQHDQLSHPALVGQRPSAARDRHARLLEPGGKPVEGGGVGDFPAEEGDALTPILGDDDALLAVVHAQRKRFRAAVDELHAQKPGAEAGPVLERLCANADISEALNLHGRAPQSGFDACRNMGFHARVGKWPYPGRVSARSLGRNTKQ